MRIIGIDPGTRFAGYSIFTSSNTGQVRLITAGCLKLKGSDPLPKRVHALYSFFDKLITEHAIKAIALETPFLGKNAQNFLKLGYVRGILYLLSQQHKLKLHEYSPREIKRAVTGSGAADKKSVARVLHMIVPELKNIPVNTMRDDVTDAIAIGLTGMWRNKNTCNKQKHSVAIRHTR